MDVLPLPPRPNLQHYKKRAKDLVAASKSTDPNAVRVWAREWFEALAKLLDVAITPFVRESIDRAIGQIEERVRQKVEDSNTEDGRFALADAQFFIARAHGFENWAEFANHLEGQVRDDAQGGEFERAADAVVSGNLSTLESLVGANPELVRARSARVHRATLLHYSAANGVEDFRQKIPPNAVAVARFLLEAGAEVDALAETYGGGTDQTTMNLLVSSTHPADAGLQPALVETLLDFGAAINGLDDDGSPLMTALAFGYGESAEALARRGARIDNVVAAAALGREDLVRRFVVDKVRLKPDVPLVAPRWLQLPRDAKAHIEFALVWACKFGRASVARFFLGLGVDPSAKDRDDMTALHWAAACGSMEIIELLLHRGAPLEVKNTWGGTVLNSTLYFAFYQPIEGVNYPTIVDALLNAGADVGVVNSYFPTGNQSIDDVLERHGARAA